MYSKRQKGNLIQVCGNSIRITFTGWWNNTDELVHEIIIPHRVAPSQVSGDGASLHPQAAAPAAGTSVVGVQAGWPEARVLRLNWSIRVGEGVSVVEPHRRADPLCWGGRRTGESRGLGTQRPWLKGTHGWFLTVVAMVGISHRWDGEVVTAQCTRRRAVFTFGCIDNVLRQHAMVGLRV